MTTKHVAACCLLMVFCWGCAGLKEPQSTRPLPAGLPTADPGSVVNDLARINQGLVAFKGIGSIKLRQDNSRQSMRIAWAGYRSEKLRLEIIGYTGRPFSAVAYDGRTLYLSWHADNRFYQRQTSNPNLERLISMPVTVPDAIAILAGRVPLWEGASTASLEGPHQGRYILTLKKKAWLSGLTAKIYLEKDLRTVRRYELYGADDALRFRVEYLQRRQFGDYRFPVWLQISDDRQNRIQINVERIWPNTAISDETFVLRPPE